MTVSATEAVGFMSQPATENASAPNQMDKDLFLKLMVAQMRNQDPANPTDSSEFLAQTAQFTALEKMQEVADQTSQLVALQVAFGASSMVGRTVTYPAADGTISTGVVDSVQFGATGPVLKVDGNDVFLAQVQSVANGDS